MVGWLCIIGNLIITAQLTIIPRWLVGVSMSAGMAGVSKEGCEMGQYLNRLYKCMIMFLNI